MNAALTPEQFTEFFEAVHGYSPYPWQESLAHQVVESGWPARVSAPTGAGKSCVIDVHVFACAVAQGRVPRRLSVVVDRRAIVDQHEISARHLQGLLESADQGILFTVRQALLRLYGDALPGRDAHPLAVTSIRGGAARDRSWVDDPLGCQIICATPQMWGSRALMRGYGAARAAQPRAAGLLTHDSVVVIDEAHLNRQLTHTARSLAEMVDQDRQGTGALGLSVVELSATLPPDETQTSTVSTTEADLPRLEGVLRRPKPTRYLATKDWPTGAPSAAYLKTLEEEVLTLVAERPDGKGAPSTVGCIVSRVSHAVRLRERLEKHHLKVRTLVGRMRPLDADRARAELDSGDLDVLIATQTVEVGVDLDLAGLVTELAPASTLAQRAGRVNRRGLRDHGRIVVVGPDGAVKDFPPYAAADLEAGRAWVADISRDPSGMTPERVRDAVPPPAPLSRRRVLSTPNRSDALLWARTSTELFEDVDLSFWLLDDLEAESPMGALVLRRDLPKDDTEALAVVAASGYADQEAYPVPVGQLRALVEKILGGEKYAADRHRAFLLAPNEPPVQVTDQTALRPGAVVAIDAAHPVLVSQVVTGELEPRYEAPSEATGVEPVILSTPESDTHDLLHALAGLSAEEAQEAYESLRSPDEGRYQVVLPPVSDSVERGERLPWLVLLPLAEVITDEEARQTWTPSGGPVDLGAHLDAVGERAAGIGRSLGLTEAMTGVLETTGRWHDRGKLDTRFQAMLGADEAPLAKSGARSRQEMRRRKARSPLPVQWRHEQLSAVLAAAELPESPHRDLIVRLVGTSHGHGRGMFAHGSAELLPPSSPLAETAAALFDHGAWDELVETTDHDYGPWFCCYLEALGRAADAQISKEGS